jgi:plasmid maintenance system antidote protein VapI
MKAIVNLKPGEILKARLNQPRLSLEELQAQMERHRQASEEFFKAARNATSKPGRATTAAG